jgi:peptide chain release factor 1
MEESMRQRLETACKRLLEIDEELASETVMKDMAHFRDISKERAVLDPQVEAYTKYKKNEEEIEGAKEMSEDADPEISEMGREEHKRLLLEQEQLEE